MSADMCPTYVLDNDELSRMVDTSDEWIMQRIGIKERRIMKEKGKATSYMGAKAVKELLKKTRYRSARYPATDLCHRYGRYAFPGHRKSDLR